MAKGNNYCVIGGAGFLGSHMVDYLVSLGHEVLVLDNLITGQKKFVNPKAKFVWCDITQSESQLRRIFEHYEIDYVMNYAAEPYIPVSFDRPLHVFNINAFAALMVMNAAYDAGVRRILQISSAEIYGDSKGKIGETETPKPHSTYGVSKMAIDGLVQVRWKEAKVPAIALRQFNCLGERETHQYVIPEIISQLNKSDVIKLGDNTFRDFLYAGDQSRMAYELLHKGQCGEVYNLGSEDGIKIYDLAYLIGKIMGKDVQIEKDEKRIRPWEIWHLLSDNSKIYGVIEARPEVNLQEALKRTVNYFNDNGKQWDF